MHKPVNIKKLSLNFSHKICFEDFSAVIPFGAKIAVTGNNGAGKSTLIKALAGENTFVEGLIDMPGGIVRAYVPQVIENFDNLSGGERFNKALSLALAQNPDILLLDEPTNHLDISNRKSLMNMLDYFGGTLIAVSHDPELLRRMDTIWHIDNGKINIFSGNYDDYMREIKLRRSSLEARLDILEREKKAMHQKLMKEQQRAAKSRQKGEISKAQAKWAPIIANSFKSKAQAAAGGKSKAINERREDINEQIKEISFAEQLKPSFNIAAKESTAPALFIMDGMAGYNGSSVIGDVNITIGPSGRAAVIGDNGSGKSTLLRAVMNANLRLGGVWETPKPEDTGYLDQHYNNIGGAQDTALSVIAKLAPGWTHAEIRKHLNDFLFRKNEEVNAKISSLSGGERARLSLAAIACKVPRLLLLDEITNNIDLQTRSHVCDVLAEYPGAMLIISHDTDFIASLGIKDIYKTEDGLFSAVTAEF